MAKNPGVKLHTAVVRRLMQSEEVKADIERRAQAIALRAGGHPDFEYGAEVVGNRVMGYVVTATYEGKKAEAETRALTQALDAGR